MASNKAQRHDFAPAWLKIPDSDSKSSGPKLSDYDRGGRGRRDDHFGGGYHPSSGPYDFPYGPPLQRQHSFDNYQETDRRYNGKGRHHSVDDDFYGNSYYNPYYNNNYNGGYDRGPPPPFRSQGPGMYRDGGGKYPPPGPRYPPGGFPPHPHHPPGNGYYDNYGHFNDFYPHSPADMGYYNPHPHPPPRPNSAMGHRRLFDARTRSTSDRDKDKENKQTNGSAASSQQNGEKKKENNLEAEDFPSLSGENETTTETNTKKTLSNSGVWEKAPISKIKSPSSSASTNNNVPLNSSKQSSPRLNGIDNPRDTVRNYKPLIPTKANVMKKGSSRDVNSNTSASLTKVNKERTMSPASAIPLDTRTVSQPKKLVGDKKSDFLKQLKMENGQTNGEVNGQSAKGAESEKEELVNGVSDLSVDAGEEPSQQHHHALLSSSIEAEERLLKEMGWTEDGEEYEITEDDLLKFKSMQQQRNGVRKPTLVKKWSPPCHPLLPIFHTPPPLAGDDDAASSSSSDSDLDC